MKKSPLRKIEDKLWELCKQITRLTYGNVCYTCPKTGLEGRDWHTGHLWAKASLGALLKYDLRVLRPQCYRCNINCGGMGAVFYVNMAQREGKRYMTKLEKARTLDRATTIVARDHYLKLVEDYQTKLNKLNVQVLSG